MVSVIACNSMHLYTMRIPCSAFVHLCSPPLTCVCHVAILESEAFGPYVPPAYAELEAVISPVADPTSPASFGSGQPTANGVAHGHAALANGPSPKLGTKVSAIGDLQPEPQQATLREQVADWVERVLIPAIQQQVPALAPSCPVHHRTSAESVQDLPHATGSQWMGHHARSEHG